MANHVFAALLLCATCSLFGGGYVMAFTVDMSCFPPPKGFGPNGPIPWDTIEEIPINSCPSGCVEPIDDVARGLPFPPEFSSIVTDGSGNITGYPMGTARYRFFENNPYKKVSVHIELTGVSTGHVITVWNSNFFPFIGPPVDPIFGTDVVQGVIVNANAAVASPAAPTTQGYTNGQDSSQEAHVFVETAPGRYVVDIDLDYDFRKCGEVPLRNARSAITQGTMNDTITPGSRQTSGFMDNLAPVGSAYLLEFDNVTGFRKVDGNGRPAIIRSPRPLAFHAIVMHTDRQTHGLNPGVPTPPGPGVAWTRGDHFLLGLIDLRAFWDAPPNPPQFPAMPFCAAP